MSGICAIFNLDGQPVDPAQLHKMADVAAYRGPDGINYWHESGFGISHLALHTTPESLSEIQPLVTPEGEFVLAADARIDNRTELIEMLSRFDATISRQSPDTALILAAFRNWKEACPKYIIGDYVFMIYDRQRKTLFCARDALGCKPVFYSKVGQKLILASEAAQILVLPEVSRDLDEIMIGNYLLHFMDAPERTMYSEIKALLPAHTLSASQSKFSLSRYWDIDPAYRIRYRNDQDYADHFREILTRSIQDRLRVQTNSVGILLSGGLDSTSVASIIQNQINQGAQLPRLDAVSYFFEQVPKSDERKYSRLMQEELGVEIDYVLADEFWLLKNPQEYKPRPDSPRMGAEGLYNHIMSRFQEKGEKVFLTGQGGDHFTQGSAQVYTDRFQRLDFRVLGELRQHARIWRTSYPRQVYQFLIRPFIPDAIRNRYRQIRGKVDPPPYPCWINPDFINKNKLIERHTSLEKNLTYEPESRAKMAQALAGITPITILMDHMGSRFGMEARHPFFDRRLAEFVLAIPPELHFHAGMNKVLLRRSLAGILPEPIRTRIGKSHGDAFFHYSLREKESQQVLGLFKSQNLGIMDMVDSDELDLAILHYLSDRSQEQQSEDWIGTNPWQVISLELWFRWYHTEHVEKSLS